MLGVEAVLGALYALSFSSGVPVCKLIADALDLDILHPVIVSTDFNAPSPARKHALLALHATSLHAGA